MRVPLLFCWILLLVGAWACAPVRVVKPLAAGEKALSFNIGGPLIGFSETTIPMPLTAVSGAYGVSDKLTAFAGLHTTALAFGVIQTDIGVVRGLSTPTGLRPGISVSPVANLMLDTWENNFKFYPQLDLNAYWHLGQRESFLYVGSNNWFELAGTRAHGERQEIRWLANFQSGYTFVRSKMNYTVELKYLAPFHSNREVVVDYRGIGGNGALGVYFNVSRKF